MSKFSEKVGREGPDQLVFLCEGKKLDPSDRVDNLASREIVVELAERGNWEEMYNNIVKLCQTFSLCLWIFLNKDLAKYFLITDSAELIMTKADLKAVPDVDIDEGVFKYVYIRYVHCLLSYVLYLLFLSI